jgi:hypothetical protein
MNRSKLYSASVAAGGALLIGTFALTGGGVASATGDNGDRLGVVETRGALNPLNNSGATGMAEVDVNNRRLDVDVDARRLLAGAPHAMHIHFGAQARHECPNVAQDDANGDFRIETLEGAAAYGPVRVSLTKRGPTGAGSVLAINRFPTAPHGQIHYDRNVRTGSRVAKGIERGNGVVVVHGVDYNGNGKYDFRSAGKSDLDPSLPAEATDPALCGVLHH